MSVANIAGLALLVLSTLADAQVVYLSRNADGTATISKSAEMWTAEERVGFAKDAKRPSLAPKSSGTRDQRTGEPARGAAVVLFVTRWCGYCRKAKSYLAEHQIPYTEYDLDTQEGQETLAQMGGGKGIPFLIYGDKHLRGFSVASYDSMFGARK